MNRLDDLIEPLFFLDNVYICVEDHRNGLECIDSAMYSLAFQELDLLNEQKWLTDTDEWIIR